MSILADSMQLLYFINGLAFFAMSLAIVLEMRRSSGVRLVDSLWLLCAFALCGAVGYWLHSLSLAEEALGGAPYPRTLQAVRSMSLVVGASLFLQFGADTIIAAAPRFRWVRWTPYGLGALGLLAYALMPPSLVGASTPWWQALEVVARAALYFPGLLLAAIGFLLHSRLFSKARLQRVASDCIGAAAAFALKAVVSGLLAVPTSTSAILSWGAGGLVDVAGVGLQVARAVTTVGIAYFVVSALRFLEAERQRQLAAANEERLRAQQDALEAQQRAREAMERWSAQLEDMVNTMAAAMSQPLSLDELLDTALCKALDLTGFEAGGLLLAGEEGAQFGLVATSGLPENSGNCAARMIPGDGAEPPLPRAGEQVVVRNLANANDPASRQCRDEGFQSLVSVPLRCRGRLLGLMNLLSRCERPVAAQELAALAAIGRQIAVAIENARLYIQVQNVAALEERSRLSRELHDGLAQVLGYLRLKSEDAQALLAEGQTAEAAAALADVHEVAREAYRDVRETLLDLRTTLAPDRSLFATLNEYLHRFSKQSGVKVSLAVGDSTGLEFEPDAEIQLLRIIQEALTNVRRHAHARKAWVRFQLEDGCARITIGDNGQGFDAGAALGDGVGQLGLHTMTERAQGVGGSVQVESMPGRGTRVVVHIPVGKRGSEHS